MQGVKPILAVVVTNAGISDLSEGHRFDKQVNVHLINRTAAKGQAREEVIGIAFWSRPNKKPERGFGCFFTSRMAASMSL